MNKSILVVDDEIQILKSLRRLFSSSKYNIFTAQSGEEALGILKIHNIDLLITDVNMPEMDGYQLLKEVRERRPSTIRIVLSGYIDGDILFKVKQENLAKLYLFKPWKNQEFINIIDQIFGVEELLKNKNLLDLIRKIDFLPTPIHIYNKLNYLINQEASMEEIANAIEKDPSIAAKVLEVANSVFYGVKTGSIRQAIMYLGLVNVQGIILSTCSFQGLENINDKAFHRDIKIIWDHCAMTNKIATFLYKQVLGEKIPNNSATAGLLHDIGKVVLMNNFSNDYLRMVSEYKNHENKYYYYEELGFLDISHQDVGGYFLNWWGLPHQIVETALFHHSPLDERVINKELVCIVNIADIYSWNTIYKGLNMAIDEDVLHFLNISREECMDIFKEIDISYP